MEPILLGVIIFSLVVALISFGFAFSLYLWVKKQPQENKKIAHIGQLIKDGANVFIRKEYRVLSIFVAVAGVILFILLPTPVWKWSGNAWVNNVLMVVFYVFGAVFSAVAGKIGVAVATIANQRTAEAAQHGIKKSFLTGFRGGSVMGMAVVGSSLLGVGLIFLIVYYFTNDISGLLGFSFGASSLALFAKAGGGIYTKTADVSADLVGKVERDMPEDDPRNPAAIADNVGDNVGDVAGMGADLFDSNVAAIAAALVMAWNINQKPDPDPRNIAIIFMFIAIGLLASILGIIFAGFGKKSKPTSALNLGTYTAMGLFTALTALATWIFKFDWRLWGAAIVGLAVGAIIGITTDIFTNDERKPVHKVASASENGPAFTILSGVSYGFLSVLPAMIGIALAALVAFVICKPLGTEYAMFGVSIAAVGMLSIVGTIVSNDAYGPIVDNARGLAEMGDLGEDVIKTADTLDSAGNTVKAVTKGFSIGAAGLTVIALLFAFMSEINVDLAKQGKALIEGFDVMNPLVFFGLIVGAAVPAVFSALLILGVDRNAQRMVAEIHRQFAEKPGILTGEEEADHEKCIDIATTGAIKELIPAGLFTIIMTLVVGFVGGVAAIGGYLVGNIVSGLLLSLFMSNSGGLWDNAKKFVEAGNNGGKGSQAHKAAVVGDTVGDPFKDTAGPSINTQITVVSLVASLMAPIFLIASLF